MGHRRKHRFRPDFEGALEDRELMTSAVGGRAALAPRVPTITVATLQSVSRKIDDAFYYYSRPTTAGSVTSGLIGLINSANSDQSVNSSPDTSNPDYRDYDLLEHRVGDALVRIPKAYGALLQQVVNTAAPNVISPRNAGYFRDWTKTLVRKFVITEVRTGQLKIR